MIEFPRITTLELATLKKRNLGIPAVSVPYAQTSGPAPGTGEGVGCQGESEHDHWGHQCDCINLPPEQEAADTSTRHSIVERYMASLGRAWEVVSYGDMIMASEIRLTGYQSQL